MKPHLDLARRPDGEKADDRRNSLRHALRRRTRAAHESLDRFLETAGFLSSSSGYQSFLIAQAHAHYGIEARLSRVDAAIAQAALGLFPVLPVPTRSTLAAQDAALDATFPAACEKRAPAPGSISTQAELLGVLYVVEGAALGAPVILKTLEENGVDVSGRNRFLGQSRASGLSRWREFLAVLERQTWSGDAADAAARAANATFDRFLNVFRSHLDDTSGGSSN